MNKKLKNIAVALAYPHHAILATMSVVSTALLIYSLVYLDTVSFLSILSYALSFYSLFALCMRAPVIYRFLCSLKKNNAFFHRLSTDYHFRARLTLYLSLLANVLYSVFQLGLGFYHHSVWFYSLSVYYLLLAVMRFFLVNYAKNHKPGQNFAEENARYRFCGFVLLTMNTTLSAIVFFIIRENRAFVHHEITTIAMAAYTFTAFTLAIVNVVRYKKFNSPVLSASKAVSLVSAIVSMLALETAMLTAFGSEGQEAFRQIITSVTGVAVVLITLFIAISMIIKSYKTNINKSETFDKRESNK